VSGEGATTPGLVCAHHHLYSALARWTPGPERVPRDFPEILSLLWWRLDRALDVDSVRASARLGALEALEAGTTAIVDHHSSPNCTEGILDVISEAVSEVGIRVVAALEVSDRDGPAVAKAELAENERFLRAGGRGLVGAHACFTLGDETLEAIAGLAEDLGVGVHIHVAEDRVDADAGRRLEHLARPSWVLAHGVHLDRPLAGTVVHNPRSNMHNAVGYARPRRFGSAVALGTDGIGGDMLDELRFAYVRAREEDVTVGPELSWDWLAKGWELVPDALGDEVRWSAEPMGPALAAFTPTLRPVQVRVGGEVVLADGKPTRVDADEVRSKALEQARRLATRL
jgi:cytosine/adenosine deaminase-related metal-dependent hydrolase